LNKKETQIYFENLINNEIDYSRYKFFYINYLIEKNNFNKVKEISNQIDSLSSSLLISQTKRWIDKKKFEEFNQIFSCQNEKDILGELLFLISKLYSNEDEIDESNFYLNISNYLNPKFKFNLSLLAENYFIKENYRQSKKILNYFNKNDDVYYWYKIKKKSQIISIEVGDQESSNFIKAKFKKIKTPTVKTLFDMANITKGFKDYKTAIHYYTEVLSKINEDTVSYGDILYRRGGSYERLGKFKESDEDLLKSLEINSDDAYALNYLAYSWLERDYKIDIAIEMLEKAYRQKENDPFILDSVGWAYYLVDDLIKAEKFMSRAIEIMPNDPIVNDHYGDILWRLDRKIQARYYWKNVLNFEDTKEKMKEDINVKLFKGPKKI
jgi:tetratricopeptide (TPR) repeat protein